MTTAGLLAFWVLCAGLSFGVALAFPLARQAAWRWPVVGAASWALAYEVKVMLEPLLAPSLQRLDQLPHAAAWGLVSAGAELLLAVACMARWMDRWGDAFAFGAGIGGFEVLFVLSQAGWEPGAINHEAFPTLFLVERALTVVGHVSSRLIVFSALQRRSVGRFCIALLLFAVVDGVATYGWLSGWDWGDACLYGRFLGALAAWTALEAGIAWWFVRRSS
jgi:hypothetical protein